MNLGSGSAINEFVSHYRARRHPAFLQGDYFSLAAFVYGLRVGEEESPLAGFQVWIGPRLFGHEAAVHWIFLIALSCDADLSTPADLRSMSPEMQASCSDLLVDLIEEYLGTSN